MMKLNSTKKWALTFSFFVAAISCYSQNNFFLNTLYNGHSSDYYIHSNWTSIPDGNYDCTTDNVTLQAGTNNYGSTDIFNDDITNNRTGSINVAEGPAVTKYIYVRVHRTGTNIKSGCYTCTSLCTNSGIVHDNDLTWTGGATSVRITTDDIHSPSSVSSSILTISGFQVAHLTWAKGSDIPDSYLYYKIYRNGTLIDTVSSSTFTFTDSTLLNTGNYQYCITTATASWGGHESYLYNSCTTPYITNTVLTATDRTYYNKTQLTWPNIATFAPNGIAIFRNGQQIDVINKNAVTYNDFDGVPGVFYTYSIAPIDANNNTPFFFTDNGASKPNGIIKGTVSTPYNSTVQGVTVVASATVDGNTIVDSTITDASGYYEFDDLFYDTAAVYTIVPHKGVHGFNPGTLNRTLSLNNNVASGVNFTDTSVFTIQGKVQFYANSYCPAGCYSQGVNITVNGISLNSITAGNGTYKVTIQQEGTYTFRPVLKDHKFSPDSIVLNVNSDLSNINFTDITSDTLFISLFNGCGHVTADQAIVTITDSNGYFRYNNLNLDTFHANAPQKLVVPAQVYTVQFDEADAYIPGTLVMSQNVPIHNALGSIPIRADLTYKDTASAARTVTTYDTIQPIYHHLSNGRIDTIPGHTDTLVTRDTIVKRIWNRADFVYHGDIRLTVPDFPYWPLPAGCSLNNGYIMAQNTPERIRIYANEFYSYDTSVTCPVDSGQITIYDDVSDASAPLVATFYNGRLDYIVNPGTPNIAAPYTKTIDVFATVGNAVATPWNHNIIVLGVHPHTATFVTRTPELPLYVMHDPPGDASYSFLQKDSSVSTSFTNSYSAGANGEVYFNIRAAAEIDVPLTGSVLGAGSAITGDVSFGGDNSHSGTYTSTLTASQQFSTSGSSDYVGSDGDVFVGASFNVVYAMADVIELSNCGVKRDTQLTMSPTGIATTYMYTEKHISQTLVPQLQTIHDVLQHSSVLRDRDSARVYQTYIDCWKNVLNVNRKNRDTSATFERNISFSAGAPYDNSITTSSDTSVSVGYDLYLNASLGVDLFAGDLATADVSDLGVKVNFQWNENHNTTTDANQSKTTGYHLEDSNPGDFFSVDVKKDRVYGTPSFALVAGTSSCPHEAGTQARDSVDLTLSTYAVYNVPVNQPAVFTANITNLSESYETRTYSIAAVPESNPNGAIIKIGGQQINNSAANFTVPAGTSLPVTVTVEAGPTAADYTGLQISASSPCDGGEGNTLTFEAHFQSTCSPIGIYAPSDNWLVNAGTHDSLPIIFSGYDINNTSLISIGLEYHTAGSGWIPVVTRTRAYLLANHGAQYYTFIFNTASMPDGAYQIRAFANCGSGPGQVTYSPILSGTIDRSSLQLFGTPSPSNGVLNITQNISVTFNGAIDCNQGATHNTPIFSSLVRNDNGQVIPDTVFCSGGQLIIQTKPASLIDSLENVTLTATVNNVYDLFGNSLQHPITWSFLVSRSKLYWNPSNLNINSVVGTAPIVTATMYNVGQPDTFSILYKPSWLTIVQPATSYAMPNGTPANPAASTLSFRVDNSLNTGIYTDTVIAFASGKRIYLFVTLAVVKPHPNWNVNPANYQYSMNVTTNYSLTPLNAPLSTDTRDTIAVFKGEECRGFAGISYDQYSNTYVAFLTAYSNSAVGDTFTFRIWDAIPGTEYQAIEKLPFINDGTIGQPLAPYILHPAGVFQTITLAPGWNWFSLNVNAADMSPKNVLSHLHATNGTVVKTLNNYTQYSTATTAWNGGLTAFNTSTSYMIQLNQADTIRLLGQPVTTNTIVSLASGWNWIGFPRQDIAPADSILKNVSATTGDILKSETEFSQYNSGRWSGSLHNMYPGEGYKLKTANAFNFVIPAQRSLPGWSANENTYQQNQTVTADLQFNSISTTQSHYIVGAFANGICVGTAQPEFLSALNLYRVFMTVHGDTANSGQALSFKVYDTDNDIEYVPTYLPISIVPDTTVARVEIPYIINVETSTGINALSYTEGYSLMQNVPNPFASTTAIQYTIPAAQQVSITLYDESGRLVKELVNSVQAAGNHSLSFEQENLQTGVYFYQMKAGEFAKTRRLVIIK